MGALPNVDGSSSTRMIALAPIAGEMAKLAEWVIFYLPLHFVRILLTI